MKSQRYGRSHPRLGFTPQEDCLLIDLVAQFGSDSWTTIASYMEKRNARQCKDRYTSYLSPTINKAPFTEEEDDLLRQKYNEIGPKWVKISKFFPNRTDISVKCRWAVLNRRDTKLNEKQLNIHSKANKAKNIKRSNMDNLSDNYSSSPIDPDFDAGEKDNIFNNTLTIMKPKNQSNRTKKKAKSLDSAPKTYCSTMTLRKRNRKKFDYNENSDDDIFDFDFDEIMKLNEKKSGAREADSSFQTVSAQSSVSTTDTNSSADSPKSALNNSIPFSSEEIRTNCFPNPTSFTQNFSTEMFSAQKQSTNISVNNETNNSSSASIFPINSASIFDIFSFYVRDNNDIFTEDFDSMITNQTINMDTRNNENFRNHNNNYDFRNSVENF